MKKKILLLSYFAACFNIFSQDINSSNLNEVTKTVTTTKEFVAKDTTKKKQLTNSSEKEEGVTTFYLINSAEKQTITDAIKDPQLTLKGAERSEKWATLLSNIALDAVYAVDNLGAKQTANIISGTQKLGVFVLDTNNMYDGSFKYNTDGKSILIVGNVSTKFANLVLGKEKYTLIEDDNFGLMYVVTVTENSKTSLVLTN